MLSCVTRSLLTTSLTRSGLAGRAGCRLAPVVLCVKRPLSTLSQDRTLRQRSRAVEKVLSSDRLGSRAGLATASPQLTEEAPSFPAAWSSNGDMVTVQFSDGATTSFNGIWLRDHCRCPSCFHVVTKQRLIDTVSIPLDIKPSQVDISDDGKFLKLVWENDGHESMIDLDWLRAHSYDPALSLDTTVRPQKLWGAELINDLPTVEYQDVMSSDKGLAQWLEHIDVYGIGFVENVPITPEATEQLGRRIAFIRETHYGTFWDFTSDLAHGDTAYTSLGLPAHTDTTYFTDPIGLQLFHLLEHDGTGGEQIYVDGFNVASQLKEKHPWAYDILSNTRISAHSAGDASTLLEPSFARPIINHDPTTGRLYQVRFNNDDRSVFNHLSADQVRDYYAALKEWTSLLRSPKNEIRVRLLPGRAVIMDNWRVLHGRAAFTGHRRLTGAYINMDDYRSRVKTILDGKSIR